MAPRCASTSSWATRPTSTPSSARISGIDGVYEAYRVLPGAGTRGLSLRPRRLVYGPADGCRRRLPDRRRRARTGSGGRSTPRSSTSTSRSTAPASTTSPGASPAAGPGVRARRRRPRPLVDPRRRQLLRRVPGGRHRPVGPRRQRPPRRCTRSSSGPTRSWPWPPTPASTARRWSSATAWAGSSRIATAALHSDELAGVIVLDSPVTEPDPEIGVAQAEQAFGMPKVYPTRRRGAGPVPHRAAAGALPRLRDATTSPAGRCTRSRAGGAGSSTTTCSAPFTREHPRRRPAVPAEGARAGSPCCAPSTAWSRPTSATRCTRCSAAVAPVVELPEAGHHGMLDQPLARAHGGPHPARRLGPLHAPAPGRHGAAQPVRGSGRRAVASHPHGTSEVPGPEGDPGRPPARVGPVGALLAAVRGRPSSGPATA